MTYTDNPHSTVLTDLLFFQTVEAITSNSNSERKLTAVSITSLQSSLSDEMCSSVVFFWFWLLTDSRQSAALQLSFRSTWDGSIFCVLVWLLVKPTDLRHVSYFCLCQAVTEQWRHTPAWFRKAQWRARQKLNANLYFGKRKKKERHIVDLKVLAWNVTCHFLHHHHPHLSLSHQMK